MYYLNRYQLTKGGINITKRRKYRKPISNSSKSTNPIKPTGNEYVTVQLVDTGTIYNPSVPATEYYYLPTMLPTMELDEFPEEKKKKKVEKWRLRMKGFK